MKWEINGRRLANPFTIARRLIAWLPFMVVRALLFIVVAFGWGFDEAKQYWDNTA